MKEDKIDVNAEDNDGNIPLMTAVDDNSIEIVEALLQAGKIDINAKDNYGNTPLSLAIRDGYKDIIDALKAKGADVYYAIDKSELYSMTDKEIQSDKLNLLDKDESNIQINDFEQVAQSDQLF